MLLCHVASCLADWACLLTRTLHAKTKTLNDIQKTLNDIQKTLNDIQNLSTSQGKRFV
jgi:hypothetical protein